MIEQASFSGATIELGAQADEPSSSKVITLAQLRRSITDCHRIEDAIWRKLRADGVTPRSSSARRVLVGPSGNCWNTSAS